MGREDARPASRTRRRSPRSRRSTRRSPASREALRRRSPRREWETGARGAPARAVHDARAGGRGLGERHARDDPGQRLLDHRLDLARAEAPTGHLHRPFQDGARAGSPRCASRRVTFEELPGGGPGRDPTGGLRRLRDGGAATRQGRAARAAERERLHASTATARRRGRDRRQHDRGRLGAAPRPMARATGSSSSWPSRSARARTTTLTLVAPPERRVASARSAASAWRGRPTRSRSAPTPGPEPGREADRGAAPRPEARARRSSRGARRLLPALGARARRRARATCARRSSSSQALPRRVPQLVRHDHPGARRRCASSPAATGSTTRARSCLPPCPQFLPPLDGGRPARDPPRPRPLADLARQPAHRRACSRTACGSSCFGQGLSRTVEDLGRAGRVADPPGAARLARGRVRRERLGREAPAADDRDVRDLPAGVDGRRPTLLETRPGQPALRAAVALPPRRRDGARQRARGERAAARRASAGRASHPYQPAGYWAYLNFPPREWDDSPGEDQYRRGLYTWWQRTFPQPSLVAFDAPSREECTGERVRSNMPQQALVLLNDPTYVEAARVFAERILRRGRDDRRRAAALRLRPGPAARPERRGSSASSRSCCVEARAEFGRDPAAARRLVATGQARGGRRPARGRARGLDPGRAGDPEPAASSSPARERGCAWRS